MHGESYGLELATNWNVSEIWKLSANYGWFRLRLHRSAISTDLQAEGSAGNNPRHQFDIRSYVKLPYKFEFDSTLYYVDAIVSQSIPRYFKFDSRIGWQPTKAISFSVGGQNIFSAHHPEFAQSSTLPLIHVRRGIYRKITWFLK